MALSDWDTFAVDENGKPTNGVLVSRLGVEVAIYKNWLYVVDQKAWEDGGAFVEPTVMEIQHGVVRYKDVDIHAVRGPKNGIYAVVSSPGHVMVGIGCSGYDDKGKWVSIAKAEVEFLRSLMDGFCDLRSVFPGFPLDVAAQDPDWHKSYTFGEHVRQIKLDGGLPFNQGGAYFAMMEDMIAAMASRTKDDHE